MWFQTRNFIVIVILFLEISSLHAQSSSTSLMWGDVKVQGSVRSRVEGWDWMGGNADDAYAFSHTIGKISFSQSLKTWEWQVELAAPLFLGLPEHAIAPAPQSQLGLGGNYFAANKNHQNTGMVFAKQGWLRWSSLFGDARQSLKLGRFEFIDGSEGAPKDATVATLKRDRIAQRIIGPFGWSAVGRSFDGLHYVFSTPRTNVTVVSALPTRGAFQANGWGNLNVAFAYASVTRQINGPHLASEWRAFGIYYQDWRHLLKTDNRPAAVRAGEFANIRIGSFGGHGIAAMESSAGVFDLTGWVNVQTGRWGTQDHRAWAAVAEAGWQPRWAARMKPWIRGGYNFGSGDDHPSDRTHGTYFQILPTPRPYARTPFFNSQNLCDAFGELILRPHKRLALRGEGHALRLAARQDLWYQGGGAFQPWSFGFAGRTSNNARSLANFYDMGADWTLNRSQSVALYYGYVQGKTVLEKIYPRGANGQFTYLEYLVKF